MREEIITSNSQEKPNKEEKKRKKKGGFLTKPGDVMNRLNKINYSPGVADTGGTMKDDDELPGRAPGMDIPWIVSLIKALRSGVASVTDVTVVEVVVIVPEDMPFLPSAITDTIVPDIKDKPTSLIILTK